MVQSKLSQSHVKYNNSPCKTKWKITITLIKCNTNNGDKVALSEK